MRENVAGVRMRTSADGKPGSAHAQSVQPAVGSMEPSHRRSLQYFPRTGADQPRLRGTSSSPVRMDPDVNPHDEKQHLKSTPRRSAQVTREDLDGPSAAAFKPLCPARPSPSFLELPSTQWRPSVGLPYNQSARLGKGKQHFSPDHQPQECFGLLECMHNNIQTQTQIAQAQLTLLEDMRESMNILLTRQERQSQEHSMEQRAPKGLASPPHPIS